MKDHQARKFVVLTTNRSGSTWLMSMLNSLPGVTAQGELFLPRPRVKELRWDSDFSIPRFVETQPKGIPVRPFSVYSYLDCLYREPKAVGFKLMYQQLARYPELLAYMMQRHLRVVHLVRRNHLDVLLSYAIKSKIGQAHLLQGQASPENLQVELKTDSLVRELEWLQRKQSFARKLLKVCRLPHIECVYEDLLAQPEKFRPILDFLSIRQDLPQSSLVKIRRGNQGDIIRNYTQVKAILADSKFAALLE
jgi:LPS sulfotransferase NodH